MRTKTVLFLCLGALLIFIGDTSAMVNDVKEGKTILECNFTDGIRQVDPELVKDYVDGVWFFTNGHSKTCRTISPN